MKFRRSLMNIRAMDITGKNICRLATIIIFIICGAVFILVTDRSNIMTSFVTVNDNTLRRILHKVGDNETSAAAAAAGEDHVIKAVERYCLDFDIGKLFDFISFVFHTSQAT